MDTFPVTRAVTGPAAGKESPGIQSSWGAISLNPLVNPGMGMSVHHWHAGDPKGGKDTFLALRGLTCREEQATGFGWEETELRVLPFLGLNGDTSGAFCKF